MNNEEKCPCNSGKTFGECCRPVLSGEVIPETAEAVMRARYSAYASGEVAYLKKSATKLGLEDFDEKASTAWSRAAKWLGLEIIKTEKGGPSDTEGVVEFRALYSANGEFCNHHEVSKFVREEGVWKFQEGELVGETPVVREEPKIGRNDPCPCGSGKKYKKCCGKEK